MPFHSFRSLIMQFTSLLTLSLFAVTTSLAAPAARGKGSPTYTFHPNGDDTKCLSIKDDTAFVEGTPIEL